MDRYSNDSTNTHVNVKSLVVVMNDETICEHLIYNNALNPKAIFVFAHGAGADMHHEFMVKVTKLLNEKQISVIRFNFPYMIKRAEDGKRRPPDRMPVLLDFYQNMITEVIGSIDLPLPLFIGGKSMGGRVAATLLSNAENKALASVKGAICIGYPFHPQKKSENLRLEPLKLTTKKILIVQGERDELGSKEEISQYTLSSLCQLIFLDDGDHSLKPRVKSGHTHQQHIESSVLSISRFIDENS